MYVFEKCICFCFVWASLVIVLVVSKNDVGKLLYKHFFCLRQTKVKQSKTKLCLSRYIGLSARAQQRQCIRTCTILASSTMESVGEE